MDRQLQAQSIDDRLDKLMLMAGPRGGPELLARLTEDLHRIAKNLDSALTAGRPCDETRKLIRSETHILISVAGSIGATELSETARALNEAAKDGDLPAPLGQSVGRDLNWLRGLIATRAQQAQA